MRSLLESFRTVFFARGAAKNKAPPPTKGSQNSSYLRSDSNGLIYFNAWSLLPAYLIGLLIFSKINSPPSLFLPGSKLGGES